MFSIFLAHKSATMHNYIFVKNYPKKCNNLITVK